MPVELSTDERLVHDWLSERGYETEYEPAIVTSGRCPDFLVTAGTSEKGPKFYWAEVKSLQPDGTSIALSKVWPVLKTLKLPDNVRGHAMLHVTDRAREQSVRAIVKLFYGKVAAHAETRARLIFVQQCANKRDIRYVEIEGPLVEKVWARGAVDQKIAVPVGTIENSQAMAITDQGGKSFAKPAFAIFDWQMPFDCALVVNVDPDDSPLVSISAMSGGSSSVSARTTNTIEEANSQIRNGSRFKAAPGVVFLVPAEEHVDDQAIAMGLYGKLTVPIDRGTGKLREAYYGRDGAFRPDKNTHISAVIRLRRNGEAATSFPNPFAKAPIEETAAMFSKLRRAPVEFR